MVNSFLWIWTWSRFTLYFWLKEDAKKLREEIQKRRQEAEEKRRNIQNSLEYVQPMYSISVRTNTLFNSKHSAKFTFKVIIYLQKIELAVANNIQQKARWYKCNNS